MKVKDLIEFLNSYNPEAYIEVIDDDNSDKMKITGIGYSIGRGDPSNLEDVTDRKDCLLVDLIAKHSDSLYADILAEEDLDGECEYFAFDDFICGADVLEGDFISKIDSFEEVE